VGSLRLDTRHFDHLGPLLDFLCDEPPEVSGRTCKYRGSKVGEPIFRLRISEDGVGFSVENANDLGWRVLGRDKAIPSARLVTRHKFSDCGGVRQSL
jgi:hypothetical protein